jgi:hypothetical protein
MSEKKRKLDPGGSIFIPLINMDIRTADGRILHPHQKIIIAHLRYGTIGKRSASHRLVFD